MNNCTLDQKSLVGSGKAVNTTTKVERKHHTTIPKGSILEKLMELAFSIPDFRRTDKGNIRHELGDIVMLMIYPDGGTDICRTLQETMEIVEGRGNRRAFR